MISPTMRPGMSSAGGWMPPQIRDRLVWSDASRYVAHCSVMSTDGPFSNTRNSFARISNWLIPPGKYSLPVNAVRTSAAARE